MPPIPSNVVARNIYNDRLLEINFKSKIILTAHSVGYNLPIEDIVLRENNHYEYKWFYEPKHYFNRHGKYKMNQDTLFFNTSGNFDFDMWDFKYGKYLLKNHSKFRSMPT